MGYEIWYGLRKDCCPDIDKKVETNIRKIFDNQTSKQFKIFPGTDITILKNEKSINAKEIYSLSSYNISKKNNLNINKI